MLTCFDTAFILVDSTTAMAMASPGPLCMSGFGNLVIVHARVLVFWIWIAVAARKCYFVGGLLKGCKSSRIKLGPWIDVYCFNYFV